MRTETDVPALRRRLWLQGAAALAVTAVLPTRAAGRAAARMAAAWALHDRQQVGLLAVQGEALQVTAALDVPTRAHGLLAQADGALLCVARRPGDWLLRWHPASGTTQWAWIEPDRAYNGHAIASADGRRLYTTETHLETGAGLIGVRDAVSLDKLAEWPTHGMDPHELLLDAGGSLMVANGGIPTLPETGRLKVGLERMDSSLVRLDTTHGTLQGQWRLPDARLSLRHIAWGRINAQPVLGIALQAEHAHEVERHSAPVLALFDGQALRAVQPSRPLSGYGGDIAFANGLFAVSCPRAQGVVLHDGHGNHHSFVPLVDACALAAGTAELLWAGGSGYAQTVAPGAMQPLALPPALRLDNHWLLQA